MAKIYSVKSGKVTDESTKASKTVFVNNSSAENHRQRVTFDLSLRTVLLILLIIAVLYLGNQILSILLFLFLGFVFMSSIRPVVLWFESKKIPKGFAVFLAYLLINVIIWGGVSLVFVPFINQLADLVSVLPGWINDALLSLKDFSIGRFHLNFDVVYPYIYDMLKAFPTVDSVKNIAGFVSGFFSVFALLLTSMIFSIYLVLEHDSFFDILLIRFSSDAKRERVKKLVVDVEEKLGSWVLGQATVSTLVMIFAGIVLSILKVPFAIPLAIIIGIFCLIPQVGATAGSLVACIVALITVGPIKALIFLILFFVYQQLENNLIVPKIMSNAVGLKPILVLLGVMICLIFLGPVGGLIAVPIMVILQIFYEFYVDLQKLKAKGIV